MTNAEKPRKRGCFFWSMIAGVVGLVLLCGVMALVSRGGAGATATTPEALQVGRLGQDMQVKEVRWKVISATDEGKELKPVADFGEAKQTGGKFVRVRFEIENQAKDLRSFAGVDLVDGQERKFIPYSESTFAIADEFRCIFENINPNLPRTCELVYEVPADATGLRLIATDLQAFGSAEAQIALDL